MQGLGRCPPTPGDVVTRGLVPVPPHTRGRGDPWAGPSTPKQACSGPRCSAAALPTSGAAELLSVRPALSPGRDAFPQAPPRPGLTATSVFTFRMLPRGREDMPSPVYVPVCACAVSASTGLPEPPQRWGPGWGGTVPPRVLERGQCLVGDQGPMRCCRGLRRGQVRTPAAGPSSFQR